MIGRAREKEDTHYYFLDLYLDSVGARLASDGERIWGRISGAFPVRRHHPASGAARSQRPNPATPARIKARTRRRIHPGLRRRRKESASVLQRLLCKETVTAVF